MGAEVGSVDGVADVGASEGTTVGSMDGTRVGDLDGTVVGNGDAVGITVG